MTISGIGGSHQPLGPGGLPPAVTYDGVKQQILALVEGGGLNITQEKVDEISGMINTLKQSGGATAQQLSYLEQIPQELTKLSSLSANITLLANELKSDPKNQAKAMALDIDLVQKDQIAQSIVQMLGL